MNRWADTATLTAEGQFIGSPGYMSPEQIHGTRLTPAADVFAYGAVPAFAATGRPPFGEGAVPTIIHRTLHEEPDLRGVPASLAQLVAACLSRDPDRRPSAKLLPALLTARTATPGWLPFLLKGKGAFILDSPHLVALDARTGKRLWSANGPRPTPLRWSPPAG